MKVGISKKDMTFYEPNIGMFGYGMFSHRAKGVETRLYVRTFIFEDDQHHKSCVCICEILTCTLSLKEAVLNQLQQKGCSEFSNSNLLVTANHTHSAAGGYSHYPFYNFPMGGFHANVLETYSNAIVESILEANSNIAPAVIKLKKGHFDPASNVAFNRSIKAYNRNKEVDIKITPTTDFLGIDPEMILLCIEDSSGKVRGSINWFGVHTTSVGNESFRICSDNKGYAATYLEDAFLDSVMAFAQKPCGDISPNPIEARGRGRIKKTGEDDYTRAKRNGLKQTTKAKDIIEQDTGYIIDGPITSKHRFIDISNIIHSEEKRRITYKGALGATFFRGCYDGYGVSEAFFILLRESAWLHSWYQKLYSLIFRKNRSEIVLKYELHGKKRIVVETEEFKFLGHGNFASLPSRLDLLLDEIIHQHKHNALQNHPILPSVLPIQFIRIGPLIIVGFPGEITNIAGQRLRKHLLNIGASEGIKEVIITPYSNAYAGYVTTPEEYQKQSYEGAHTLFGKNTLEAYKQEFEALLSETPSINEREKAYVFPLHIIQKRGYRVAK